jgi:hypothetical protein
MTYRDGGMEVSTPDPEWIFIATHMNRPISLLHMVGREEICHSCQLVEQIIFEPKHWGRPNDGGFGKYGPSNPLSSGLFALLVGSLVVHIFQNKLLYFGKIRMAILCPHCRKKRG